LHDAALHPQMCRDGFPACIIAHSRNDFVRIPAKQTGNGIDRTR